MREVEIQPLVPESTNDLDEYTNDDHDDSSRDEMSASCQHDKRIDIHQISQRVSILFLFVLGWYCHVIFLANSSSANQSLLVPPQNNDTATTILDQHNSTVREGFQDHGSIQMEGSHTKTTSPTHMLHSYSYSNCPFTMAKFSQYELASEGPFTSDIDRFTNSIDRAKMGLDFSNSMHAYERVVNALENNAFDNRKVILDGDSLTRQFFISLSCLAWSAGYVEHFEYPQVHGTYPGSVNSIMNNAHYTASSKFFGQAFIRLKGGGEVHYVSNPSTEKIKNMTQRMVHEACDSDDTMRRKPFQARHNYDLKDTIPLVKEDVLVLAAGHHAERSMYIGAYQKMFQCMKYANSTRDFKNWPHMMYQLSSVESFWTQTGMFEDKWIDGSDRMTCQSSPKSAPHRDEEREILRGLVPLIGDTIDLENLGHLHVWHGDCLHWIQPGIPDLYAAELADFLLSTKP